MGLTIGSRLGPYEILAAIGAGGMGEVYRATDTNLKRSVAIKVLPDAVAMDPDRLARFQREAEVLAALNHPNIAGIYGLERVDGQAALVMELVEGPTLADLIALASGSGLQASGAAKVLPIGEALAIARQIAEALEAAHERGIIHRDLKPANVKVRPDGAVKVLDFGLAKAMEPSGIMSPGLSHSPTITTPAMTQAGMILGTAAYMSPEQARGKAVDKRTDVWAFGCVLFEMLTGQRAFGGEDVTETLAAVVKSDPDWTLLPSGLSSSLRTFLVRCLQKNPKQRIADIQDVRLALEGAFETAAPQPEQAVPLAQPRGWRQPLAVGAIAAVASLALAALIGWSLWPNPAPSRVTRSTISQADQPVLAGSTSPVVALSPSGTHVVFRVTNGDRTALVARALDSLETTTLYEGAAFVPFFSPDSAWVGFADAEDDTIKRVAITGGPALRIGAVGAGRMSGATWLDDDTIVFGISRSSGLWRVPVASGTPEPLTTLNEAAGETSHEWPELLPGRAALLFTIRYGSQSQVAADNAKIAVLDLETREQKVLVSGGSAGRYVPTGHLVYAYSGTLRAVPFDLDRLEVTGNPVAVLENVMTLPITGGANFGVSNDGSLVYLTGSPVTSARTPIWVDRKGIPEPIERIPPAAYGPPRLAPDGARFLTAADGDAWIFETTNGRRNAVTSDGRTLDYLAWSPDGSKLAYTSTRSGTPEVWVQSADGSGEPERVAELKGSESVHVDSWAPDGKTLAVHQHTASDVDVFLIPLGDPGQTPQPAFRTPGSNEAETQFSPDGRYIAYVSTRTNSWEIEIRPSSGSGGRVTASVNGGVEPIWARNGELFYRHPVTHAMMRIRVSTDSGLTVSTPEQLFSVAEYAAQPAGGSPRAWYDVTADGQHFLMLRNVQAGESRPTQLVLVQQWFEELKRLVPTR